MKNKKDILLNINSEDSNINEFLYCYKEFGSTPNRYIIHSDISYDVFLSFLNKLENLNKITEVDNDFTNVKVLSKYNNNLYISYFILEAGTEFETFSSVTILYKEEKDLEEIKEFLQDLTDFDDIEIQEDDFDNKNKLSVVNILGGSLSISEINNDSDIENIDLYYSEKTFKSIKKITKKINKNNKSLSIFLGERGTGKTSIINYISEKVNKSLIYIPNNVIEHTINNPEFKNLLKNYKNSLFVMDDCEVIFNDIYTKSNIITSNLLQMIDGIDSDEISVSFLLIFNTDDESEIDENILDCNNLLDVITFEYLSEEESNELSKHLNQKGKYKEETKLLNILKGKNKNQQSSIGF
jgi:ABC-type dipeptide/oligopeptide/nickel transport system ATPase subunit